MKFALTIPPGVFVALVDAGFFGIILAILFFRDDRIARKLSTPRGRRGRYRPYGLSLGIFSPVFILLNMVLSYLRGSSLYTVKLLSPIFLDLFLHISLICALLALAQPLLRRYFSARACAALWLLPGILYFFYSTARFNPTLLEIRIPYVITKYLPILWFAGFIAIMGWNILSHILFRKKIMWIAAPVKYGPIYDQWVTAQLEAGLPKPIYPLYTTSEVDTPFSIGLFRKHIRVILPKKDYTPEELDLIFRHELVHIGRKDSNIKFAMVFYAAIIWFNPLMWYALRSSNDDMELSCDETVLLNQPYAVRQKYGKLLLSTAGETRGFTTCLSASAKSMAYRLQNSLKARQRKLGCMLIAVVLILLTASLGFVTIAAACGSLQDMIVDISHNSIPAIMNIKITYEEDRQVEYKCSDQTAFWEIMDNISVYRVNGKNLIPDMTNIKQTVIYFSSHMSLFHIYIYQDTAIICTGMGRSYNEFEYKLDAPIPWDALLECMTPVEE